MEMDSLTNGVLLVLGDFRYVFQCVSWQKDCREVERRNIADGKMHDKRSVTISLDASNHKWLLCERINHFRCCYKQMTCIFYSFAIKISALGNIRHKPNFLKFCGKY